MASAVNDWLAAEWLAKEPRLRASMVVPTRVPEMGAEEIDRVGDHPGFVQVLLPVRSEAPYGHRRYLPIFAAADRHNLVVSLQFGGAPGENARVQFTDESRLQFHKNPGFVSGDILA